MADTWVSIFQGSLNYYLEIFIVFFRQFIKNSSIILLLLLSLSSCTDRSNFLEPLKILCLGDSITYGYKLADPSVKSYPAQLSRLSFGHWDVVNAGVNGATVLNNSDLPITAQQKYERAIKCQPDVVILMLGTNDTKDRNWRHKNQFVYDYAKLVERFKNLPSQPHVIVCSIPPIFGVYSNGINEKRVREVNIFLKQFIVENKIDFLEIHTPLSKKELFLIDGIHPNERGAQEIAKLVFKKVSQI
ncbi:MAG: hypothetical protein KAR01_10650 [Desulfocapsa sp.]|nr:hypothetical protein [Desulfocapsa sp.]